MPFIYGVSSTPHQFAREVGIEVRDFCEQPHDGGIDCSSIPFNGNVKIPQSLEIPDADYVCAIV